MADYRSDNCLVHYQKAAPQVISICLNVDADQLKEANV